jgi:hypothetical protein
MWTYGEDMKNSYLHPHKERVNTRKEGMKNS